ncbi:hypothetical protein GE061_006935 [Apolygus lucorum]|uniref:Uncharacterized protein n=1 Tax=Apolygus lucorum TaxID=248454 RepID=A0A8S9WQ87_APOLU|nr:hypothetical protein GE061_006935 [Apolygus lucorum]
MQRTPSNKSETAKLSRKTFVTVRIPRFLTRTRMTRLCLEENEVMGGGKHEEGREGSAGWTDGLPQSQQSIFSSQRYIRVVTASPYKNELTAKIKAGEVKAKKKLALGTKKKPDKGKKPEECASTSKGPIRRVYHHLEFNHESKHNEGCPAERGVEEQITKDDG